MNFKGGLTVIIVGLLYGLSAFAQSAPFESMAAWKSTFFTPEQIGRGLADDDYALTEDGVSNLVKYAMGLIPWPESTKHLPSLSKASGLAEFKYRQNHATDISCTVEISSDLLTWQAAGSSIELISATPLGVSAEQRVVRYTGGAPNKLFMRLKIERTNQDTDNDGLPDDWEIKMFGSLLQDGSQDSDEDGVSDAQERLANSNPLDPYNGVPPPIINRPLEEVAAELPIVWAIFMLPSGYDPVMASASGVAVLARVDGQYRWDLGQLRKLTATGGINFINGVGTIVGVDGSGGFYQDFSNAYGGNTFGWGVSTVKVWERSASLPLTISVPTRSSSTYYDWYEVYGSTSYSAATAIGVDDLNKVYYADGFDFLVKDLRGSSSKLGLPANSNLLWVTKLGVTIGTVFEEPDLVKCLIGSSVVNLAPTYANGNGAILGTRNGNPIIRYADGVEDPQPTGGVVSWIDDLDRPCGEINGRKVSWQRVVNQGGGIGYQALDFEPFVLRDGWTTDHQIPFGTRAVQLGVATKNNATRPFLAIATNLLLGVDGNRDNQIEIAGNSDATTQANPYRFWINDDDDGLYTNWMESEEDDLAVTDSSKEDWRNNVMDVPRDLEDFARLHLYVGGLQDAFKNGQLFLGLKWTDTNGTSPSIKLYRATSPADNDTAYLAEGTAANRQFLEVAIVDARYPAYSGGNFQSDHTQIGTGGFFVLPAEQALLLTEQSPTLRFIFEGCTTGKGQLKLVILKKENGNYTEIGEGPGVWLDIKNPREFIQRWTCGDGSLAAVQPVQFDAAKSGTFAAPTKDEEKDLVLFVHGYNEQGDWEKQRWIETTFKRLYWMGYKGRVGGFVWPCVLDGPTQFNASEERAWQSGEQLKVLFQQLKAQGYRVHVLAHSQGNVVVGEALRQGGPGSALVSTYVASQAALAVHGYDASQPERSGSIAFTPNTPNVYARYWTSLQNPNLPETWGSGSPSYFAPTYTQGAADKFVNFYNPQDYALTGNGFDPYASDGTQTGWLVNQRLKPWIGYDYVSYIGFRESPLTNLSPRQFRFPDDRFIIFSYGAQARSIALGAGASGGVFNGGNVNLFDAPTSYRGHHVFHSGQFRSNYAYRWAYWRQLMISCDLAGRNAP